MRKPRCFRRLRMRCGSCASACHGCYTCARPRIACGALSLAYVCCAECHLVAWLPCLYAADIVPVLDGLTQPSTAQRLPYGMQHLARHLGSRLAARGISVPGASSSGSGGSGGGGSSFAADAPLEDLARSIARVAGSAEEAAPGGAPAEPTTHTLPDGQRITIEREGLELGEALMDGGRLGLDLQRLSQAVYTAATAQGDKDTRKVGGAGQGQQQLGGALDCCGCAWQRSRACHPAHRALWQGVTSSIASGAPRAGLDRGHAAVRRRQRGAGRGRAPAA